MATHDNISVAMPFYKNEKTLLRSIRSICAQKHPALREIVVADDGGPVRAEDIVRKYDWPLPVVVLQSGGGGQSKATNLAIKATKGDLVILTCADITFSPNFIVAHQKAHAMSAAPQGVIGHITYAPWVQMTPFMRFLDHPGPQFDFEAIKDPQNVAACHVYAPNFSAPREVLLDHGPFDEKLPYGFQDIDLGISLKRAGINLRYAPESRALHDHPNNLQQFFNRQRRVGMMLPHMISKHPDSPFGDKFRILCEQAEPLLPNVDSLLQKLFVLEKKVCQSPGAFSVLKQPLFEAYDFVMTLAFIVGVLENTTGLQDMQIYDKETLKRMTDAGQRVSRSLSPLVANHSPTAQPKPSMQAPCN